MPTQPLDQAQKILGVVFHDPELLERALTHSSHTEDRLESNERLEFLGDAVLGLVVSRRLFDLYPDLLEGELTKIKSAAVSRQTCAVLANELGLTDLLQLGKGMRHARDLPQSLAAAVFESIIAAIYLDAGIERVESFLAPLIDPLVERAADSGHHENFKSVLQQHAQQGFGETPQYRILDEKGPDHSKCFKVAVEFGGKRFDAAWGPSKKQAEQQAALNALSELGLVEPGDDGHLRVVGSDESEGA